MKSLIIKAHPSSKGFTHQIANRYIQARGSKNVKVIDLYRKDDMQPYLEFENIKDLKPSDVTLKHQKLISEADELVFIFPIWWSSCPAVMKNFLDTTISSGFAFKYDKNGKLNKLLKGKTARVFITCDGPSVFYRAFLEPMWRLGILGYCGIKTKSFIIFGRKRFSQKKYFDWLVKVEKLAKQN